MKKQKQPKKIILGVAVFVAVFMVGTVIKASVSENTTGWLWGGSEEISDGTVNGNETGVGWISMNNLTGGGGVSYGVNIPPSSCSGAGCDLVGSAWSENLGWISFNRADLGGCPSGDCGATRSGDSLAGWARIMSIKTEYEKVPSNSGGWTGWIHLNDTSGFNRYGVTIESATGKFLGHAWSADLVDGVISGPGYVAFSGTASNGTEYGALIPPPPTATLSAEPGIINVDTNPTWASGTPILLTWDITDATTCTRSWNATPVAGASGSETVSQTTQPVTYSITCNGPSGSATASTLPVYTACYAKVCASEACVPSSTATPATTSATCTPLSVCSTDSDCKPRSTGTWIEVAP